MSDAPCEVSSHVCSEGLSRILSHPLVRATMALLLRTDGHGRRARNRGFLVSRRAVLRLRRNTVSRCRVFPPRSASCSWRHRLPAGDFASFASYRAADFGNSHGGLLVRDCTNLLYTRHTFGSNCP